MQLQQIRPDFSGSAESMAQAQRGIQQVGTFANEWMDRLAKEKAVATEEARYQTELARQDTRDKLAADQWTKSFGLQEKGMTLQEAAGKRAEAEDVMKRGTRQAYGQADTLLGAPGITQAQASNVNAMKALQQAQAQGRVMTPVEEAQIAKAATGAITKNQSTLEGQRQLLMEQGPVREVYNVDPVTGEVVTNRDIDTTAQIALKEGRLGDIDTKIAARDKLANEWSMLKFKEAGDNARLGRTLKAQQEKPAKFEPVRMTYFLDKNGKVSANPTSNPITVDIKSQAQMDQLARTTGVFDPKGNLTGMKAIQGDWKGDAKLVGAKTVYGSKAASGLNLDVVGRGDTSRALAWANATLAKNPSLSEDQAVGIIQQALDKNIFNDEVSKTNLNAVLKGAGLKEL